MKTEKFDDWEEYPHHYELSKQHFEITGFRTLAEMAAYEKGQEHREAVLIGFIKEWDGSTNSIFGKILHDFIQSHKPKKP
jgi:hypothetical protein